MSASHTLLLTVDFINDIVHPDGKIPSCAAMTVECGVIARTNQALIWARSQGFHVAHVKVGFPRGYPNCPASSPVFGRAKQFGALQLGEWGTEFHDDLDIRPDEQVIVKSRIGLFYGTQLETLLRAHCIERIVLAGVSTNHAIESAVRDAHDRDYRVTVLSDCCAAASTDVHEQTIKGVMSHLAQVRTLDELKSAC
jgi:nicotinamidase-related amidase